MTDETRKRLDEIRVRADAATPGPWRYDDGITDDLCDPPERGKPTSIECLMPGRGQVLIGDVVADDPFSCEKGEKSFLVSREEADRNGRFIAAAREDVEWLLGEVERLSGIRKATQATFVYAGKIQPTPVPDMDD